MVAGGNPEWIRTQEHITHGAQIQSAFKVLYLFLSPSHQLPLTLKLFICNKDDVFFLPIYPSVLETFLRNHTSVTVGSELVCS